MRHLLLSLSVALNIALLAAWFVQRPNTEGDPQAPSPSVREITAPGPDHEEPPGTKPRFQPAGTPLDWRAVESDDYPTYIANLRSVGVPPATIRDIIVADVGQLYDQRRAALAVATFGGATARGIEGALIDLDREEREVLDRLLGRDWDLRFEAPRFTSSSEGAAGLAPEALAAARRIDHTYQEEEERLREQAGLFLCSSDRESLAALKQQRRDELVAALGEQGFLEYEFQFSGLGRSLQQSPYFTWPDADEVRGVFEILYRFEGEQTRAAGLAAEEAALSIALAEEERHRALREQLGDDRYIAYQRSLDFRYQQLHDLLTKRWGLAP